MPNNPSDVFRTHWTWLRNEYNALDANLRERLAILRDPKVPDSIKVRALIDATKLLCQSFQALNRRQLFDALLDDVSANSTAAALQDQIAQQLEQLLHLEEHLLIQVGVDPKAAQALRADVTSLPAATWRQTPLGSVAFKKKVHEAIQATCAKPPATYVEYKVMGWVRKADELKRQYGLIGGVTIAAANAVAIHTIPEPVSVTKFSSLIGYIFGGSGGGAA